MLKKPPAESVREVEPRLVEVISAEVETITFEIHSTGFVRARDESVLSAAVAGPVLSTGDRLYPGEFFQEGEELLRIDPADTEAAIAQARARVAMEESLLAKEEARSEIARRDWKTLGRSGEPPPLVVLEPQLKQIRSSLSAAKADLALAETNLERSIVKAPFDALVTKKEVEVGHYVTAGTPLVTLLAIDYAEIRLPVSLDDLRFLDLTGIEKENSDLEVSITNGDVTLPGTVVRTENVIEESTRSLYLVVRIADPYRRHGQSAKTALPPLTIGQFVEAALPSRPVPNLTRLPHRSMRGRDEVVIANDDMTLAIREVTIIYETDTEVFVRGLSAGDKVVLSSPARALPGEKVEIKFPDKESRIAPKT